MSKRERECPAKSVSETPDEKDSKLEVGVPSREKERIRDEERARRELRSAPLGTHST